MKTPVIETERLIMRRWHSSDLQAFTEINADPRVMEYFPATLSQAETEAMIKTIEDRIDQHGFGFWATELKNTGEFVGFIGLNVPGYPLPFSPCVEIGWRLAHKFWGSGLAPEGARACLQFGFRQLGLAEIVAFTTVNNLKSRRVMEKIGMQYDHDGDFDHPRLAEDHHLRQHVLYRSIKGEVELRIFELQSNGLGLETDGRIRVSGYDDRWPEEFKKESSRIATALKLPEPFHPCTSFDQPPQSLGFQFSTDHTSVSGLGWPSENHETTSASSPADDLLPTHEDGYRLSLSFGCLRHSIACRRAHTLLYTGNRYAPAPLGVSLKSSMTG